MHNYTKVKGLDLEKITSLPKRVQLTCVISVIVENKLRAHHKTHLHTVKVITGLIPIFHGLRLERLGPPFNCNGPTKKTAAFLESCSAKGSLSNNISQHIGSFRETRVPIM